MTLESSTVESRRVDLFTTIFGCGRGVHVEDGCGACRGNAHLQGNASSDGRRCSGCTRQGSNWWIPRWTTSVCATVCIGAGRVSWERFCQIGLPRQRLFLLFLLLPPGASHRIAVMGLTQQNIFLHRKKCERVQNSPPPFLHRVVYHLRLVRSKNKYGPSVLGR